MLMQINRGGLKI